MTASCGILPDDVLLAWKVISMFIAVGNDLELDSALFAVNIFLGNSSYVFYGHRAHHYSGPDAPSHRFQFEFIGLDPSPLELLNQENSESSFALFSHVRKGISHHLARTLELPSHGEDDYAQMTAAMLALGFSPEQVEATTRLALVVYHLLTCNGAPSWSFLATSLQVSRVHISSILQLNLYSSSYSCITSHAQMDTDQLSEDLQHSNIVHLAIGICFPFHSTPLHSIFAIVSLLHMLTCSSLQRADCLRVSKVSHPSPPPYLSLLSSHSLPE
jgi:hypothetical protein